jgi:hypothetical protein
MNLKIGHLPVLFGGALAGSALGYLLCIAARSLFLHIEDLPNLGLVFGSLVGMSIVVFAIIVAASRNRDAEVPEQFTSINGIGSTLYGRSDLHDDGSYVATEWFTFIFVPILPICSYRVIKTRATIIGSDYQILEKFPPRTSHIIKGYVFTAAIVSSIILFALYVRN